MAYLIYLSIFIFGLCVGSFLNVVVYRLPKGIKISGGRSFCPNCNKKIIWRENIPLFSYLFLKGKCSSCKRKISIQYPIIELITGLLFLLAWRKISLLYFDSTPYLIISLFYCFIIIAILIAIFFIDLKHYIIPDKLIIFGVIATIIYLGLTSLFLASKSVVLMNSSIIKHILPMSFIRPTVFNNLFINNFIFAIIGVGFFGLLVLITKGKGMGMGDLKLAGLMGLMLGGGLIEAFYISFITGAVLGLFLIITNKKGLKSEIPFGPFLVFSTLALILI